MAPSSRQSFATVNNVADEAYIDAGHLMVWDVLLASLPVIIPAVSVVIVWSTLIYDSDGSCVQDSPIRLRSTVRWVPSGDDAAGIYYTQQTYDWQGRPLERLIPTTPTRKPLTAVAAALAVKW